VAAGPLLTGPDASEPVLVAESVGLAMLPIMEELSPPERVAFVLHDVFGLEFGRVAEVLDVSVPGARQPASRARRRVANAKQSSPQASKAEHERVLTAFRTSYEAGDLAGLVRLPHPDAVYVTDGGGKAAAMRKPIYGGERVAEVMVRVGRQWRPDRIDLVEVGGELARRVRPRHAHSGQNNHPRHRRLSRKPIMTRIEGTMTTQRVNIGKQHPSADKALIALSGGDGYDRADSRDGLVSIEVDPRLPMDSDGTVTDARLLWQTVRLPNLLGEDPGDREGLPATTTAPAEGIGVNVTLIFSPERYRAARCGRCVPGARRGRRRHLRQVFAGTARHRSRVAGEGHA
jgi:hypothetical protein